MRNETYARVMFKNLFSCFLFFKWEGGRNALLHTTVVMHGYSRYCHLSPVRSLTTCSLDGFFYAQFCENIRDCCAWKSVSQILKVPCLASAIIPQSNVTFRPHFPILTFGLNNSWTSWPPLRAFMYLVAAPWLAGQILALTSWCRVLPNTLLSECILTIHDTISVHQKIMFQYKNRNIQFRSWIEGMNKHIVLFLSSLLFHVQPTYFRFGSNTSLLLQYIDDSRYRHIYGTKYLTCLWSYNCFLTNIEVYFVGW